MVLNQRFSELQLSKVEQLLGKRRKTYTIDLHLHTNHSMDGVQTVEQAIMKAKEKNVDIISIADHDSIAAYDEVLHKQLYLDNENPIIIPGIEFTVSFPEYNGRCHILKYFYDSTNPDFRKIISQNDKAFKDRVSIWFERIQENSTLQYYFKKYNIICSKKFFDEFLKKKGKVMPDYPLIMEYLFSLLEKEGITVWDIYYKTMEYNELDPCEERKLKRRRALQRFYGKYCNQDISKNYKKIKPLLAPLGIDDSEYPGFPSTGSLSINEYGQVPIELLDNTGINIFAHPNEEKLDCIDNVSEFIWGLEINAHSDEETNDLIYKKVQKHSLALTKGSDKHEATDEFYEDMDFYSITHDELKKFVDLVHKALEKK